MLGERDTVSASRATSKAPLSADSAITTVRLSSPMRPILSNDSWRGRRSAASLSALDFEAAIGGSGVRRASAGTCGRTSSVESKAGSIEGGGASVKSARFTTAGSTAGSGVSSLPPGGPKPGMGVIAARGDESSAGTGTPRAGGGTAPGGRSVAVAGRTPCSSESVGIGARARCGGGGGPVDGRAAVGARRAGPSVPKLVGATDASAIASASSVTRLAGSHSAQPERQTSVPLRKVPLRSAAQSSRLLPDNRAPSAASQ